MTPNLKITPEEIKRRIFTKVFLIDVGQQAIAIIKERTGRGQFLPGSSPGSDQYSTTPAPMPAGALAAKIGKTRAKALWARLKRGEEDIEFIGKKRTWILLKGGYKRLRELAGRESDHVTLNWTGTMLRALKKIDVDENTDTITISFTDNRSAELADFQHLGAGKNKKKKIFFALTQEEGQRILKKKIDQLNFKL